MSNLIQGSPRINLDNHHCVFQHNGRYQMARKCFVLHHLRYTSLGRTLQVPLSKALTTTAYMHTLEE